jgi:pimeloyl-ACP methyl ester carboxylesterase
MSFLHHKQHRTGKVNTLAKSAGVISAVGLGVPLLWIGYSALFVDHHLPLPPAIDATRRTFTSPEAGTLSYYVDKMANGRPLVLLHSINAGASAYEMHPLFEHYREQRPVYALDLPGFGFSDRSDRVYSAALYTSAIIDFLQQEVPRDDGVDLIALSLSSEFAARAAHRHPDLIRSLALISPTGFTGRGSEHRGERSSQSTTAERLYRAFAFPLWSQAFYDLLVTRASIRYFLKHSFAGPVDQGLVDYDYVTTHQPGARYAPLYFVSGKLFTSDIRSTVYEQVEQPVLVLYDQDPYIRFDTLPGMIEQHANWQATRITPTRGLPHFEQMNETAQALDAFWGEVAKE